MAINTFGTLRTAITDRLGRADFTDDQLKECVALAETRIEKALRPLGNEVVTTFSIDAQFEDAPDGFMGLRALYITDGGQTWTMQFMPPENQVTQFPDGYGAPQYYAVVGLSTTTAGASPKLMFAPVPDKAYSATMVYFQRMQHLSADADANTELIRHPEVYLYGTLLEAAMRVHDDGLVQRYGTLFQSAIDEIKKSDAKTRFYGPSMSMRPA